MKWFLAQEMRRLTLFGTFALLLAALFGLWQYRFERSPGYPSVRLSDLRKIASPTPGVEWLGPETAPGLRLRVDPIHFAVVARVDLPPLKAVDFLHVRFHISATDLRPGHEIWADGRCMIEWHPQAGSSVWENDPFYSVRHHQTSGDAERVLRPNHPPATPTLRLENLGASGDLQLSMFEATVLRERWIWKIGRWLLMAGWLAWAVAWIGPGGKIGWFRPLLASAIWLVMGLYFVVPGPWKDIRSFGHPFQIGSEITVAPDLSAPVVRRDRPPLDLQWTNPAVLESVGEISDQGDFTLRLKHYATNARPLLHMILLFAPALALACLVGQKPARSLTIILSLAIEAAQAAFGYGFDWMDVCDLANDAIGIALGLWLYSRIKQHGWGVGWLIQKA